MRLLFLGMIALILSACSAPHDKYVGYWKLEDSKQANILEIKKEDKDTYLVNENILRQMNSLGNKPKEMVLEKKEDQLAINNKLMLIPLNLSSDGKTLRIDTNKYTKISEADAKTTLKNHTACTELRTQFQEEKKPFDGFFFGSRQNPNQDKLDAVKSKYTELKSKIPECDFTI